MPFTFKLSKRLALMKASLVPAAAAALAACQLQDRLTAPTSPNNSVMQVVTSPDTVALQPAVVSVTISPTTTNINVGDSVQLTATLKDTAGNVLSERSVVWISSAWGVATVSASGLVTGAAAGAATITATSEGQTGSAAVTVNDVPVASVASVSVSPAATGFLVGQSVQLTATPKDAAGNILTGRAVTWTRSNPAIATVSRSEERRVGEAGAT